MIIDTNSEGYRRDMDFLAVHFGKGNGKKAIKIMKSLWMDIVVADPNKDPAHAFFTEGERSLVMKLIANVENYNEDHTGDKDGR